MDPSAPKPRAETAGKDLWHPGERCLAPSPDSEKLCEASIKSVVNENGKSFAVVLYSDFHERKVPLKRLQEIKTVKDCSKNFIFDDEDLEKPYFPDRKFPSSAIAFQLIEGGDSIPYTINRYLRDYQREGAQFLYGHFIRGRGCILGDDMGLGKTVQVISFLAAVLHKQGTREDIENNMPAFLLRSIKKESPSITKKMFLIVAPLSVLYNWRDELDTWGYFRVSILHGNKKENELIRVKQRKCEIALTTYETLRLYLDELNSLEWSAIIVDEAHRIKNPKARVTEVMKALKCNVRIGLTGTILQNNMKELWCVMDWAVPGLLGSMSYFKKQFSDPVEHGQRHTATKRELATGRKAMQRLAKKMSGWFLRRTKTLIKDQLPKKEDRMVYCSLTDFQKAVYQTVLESEDVTLILQSSEPCTCNSGRKRRNCCYKTNSHGETVKTLYFSYLAVLQKVANHVALLQTISTSKQQETLIKRICDKVFSRFPDFVQKSKDAAFETLSDPKYSGKMKVLQQLLNHCRKNKDKVLLFSFSTKLLDVLQQYCMASGLDFRRLDGSTKSEERIKIVKEFNSTQDVNICLVSTMAGGLGLNFVGANVVVLFDPTWNPANDLQAIDRAYRIGQCRDVKVLRLISLGTVEEIMYLRQIYKQQLHCVVVGSENAKRYFEAVQGSKEHRGELFGVCNLFKLRSQGSCLTRDILEREGQVEAGIMTATTWLKEEPAVHEVDMSREPDCQEHKDPEQPPETLAKEACDFCSDFSDDESGGNSRIKTVKNKVSDLQKASDDDLSVAHISFSKQKYSSKAVKDKNSFSSKLPNHKKNNTFLPRKPMKSSKERVISQEQTYESVDKLLDGVQEVAYIHSNQNVIGSSKAENHMSRWAARDVFELKQFSQLPANIAVCTSEIHTEKRKSDTLGHAKKDQQPSEGSSSFSLYLSHPVSQKKKKKIYHADQTTFIIGETPKVFRRKQFEEMSSFFKFSSKKEFAEHITNATSEERQKMLKDFYVSQYPEVEEFFVDSASESINSANEEGKRIRSKPEKRKSIIKERLSESETLSLKDSIKNNSQMCIPKVYKRKSIKFQNHGSCSEEVLSSGTEAKKLPINSTQEIDNEKNSQTSEDSMASCSLISKSEAYERKVESTIKDQQDPPRTGILQNGPLFKVKNKNIENPVLENTSVVGLLGDTSILDDLFKSHGNSPTRLPKKVLSEPVEKVKQRPKDFWDILNEQNDDSLSKLTDLAVIETLCEKVPRTSSSKRKEKLETSLWKSNEKFLWKKFYSADAEESTTNTQE
ncbi:PREDICTED: DNA excision repair protein ERCC-6-like 2 isoform X2 [Condylura cristata]|uniref:DNA excision repair protein ERCC-6-like 2 isoform X2 n=1 Tax=Condylura cristata TaxID=143302 RepID=UPI000642B368|nr:PREDICTED: DNA excision repair protein ERCC-6-like 2 isoform X2 [Condylura cristata]